MILHKSVAQKQLFDGCVIICAYYWGWNLNWGNAVMNNIESRAWRGIQGINHLNNKKKKKKFSRLQMCPCHIYRPGRPVKCLHFTLLQTTDRFKHSTYLHFLHDTPCHVHSTWTRDDFHVSEGGGGSAAAKGPLSKAMFYRFVKHETTEYFKEKLGVFQLYRRQQKPKHELLTVNTLNSVVTRHNWKLNLSCTISI